MKIKAIIAVSVLAVAAATNAQAADPYVSQYASSGYAMAPAFSWNGFYLGGQIGESWSSSTVHSYSDHLSVEDSFSKSFSPDANGFIGGLYVGYNFTLANNLLLGAETDWVWGDIKDHESGTRYNYDIDAGLKEKWAGATRARLGYAADRWLPYLALGVAYTKVNSSVNTKTSNATVGKLSGSDSDTLTGWTVGAGLDYAMGDNIILRAEYRYSDYGDQSYGHENLGYKVDYKTNDIRIGVAYKF